MGLCMKRRAWLGLAVAIAFAPAAAFAQDGLVIFAAASLKNALDEIATGWKDSGKPAAKISYAASSALAKQLEQGAPADMFISADLDWMDYAAGKNLIKADTRFNLLGNNIVVNSRMETKIPGVYAAGDICAYDGKLKLIATGFGEAAIAVNHAKHYVDPKSKVNPGHSSENVPEK